MAEVKAYWQELVKKYGISSDVAGAVEAALGNEAVSKAFSEGFVTTPDHHRTLDTTVGPLKQKVAQYDDWYEKQAKPLTQHYTEGLSRLQQYESMYGPINGGGSAVASATGLTEAQLNKILEDRLNSYATVNSQVAKTFARASADYMKRFGEVLDLDDFEAKATENARRGKDPWTTYQEYISPRQKELDTVAEAKRKEETEALIKQRIEEGVRDRLSRSGVPVEAHKEPSMLHLREEARSKNVPVNGYEAEQNARAEFFAGWNEATTAKP